MSGRFADVWSFEEAAEHMFTWQQCVEIVYNTTSVYLVAACLISVVAVVWSWNSLVRSASEEHDRQTDDRRLKTEDCRLKTEDRRLETEVRRLKTEDRRLQTEDHKQQTKVRGHVEDCLLSCEDCSRQAAPDGSQERAGAAESDRMEAAGDTECAIGIPSQSPAQTEDRPLPADSWSSPADLWSDPAGPPDPLETAHHLPSRIKRAELGSLRRRLRRDMTQPQMDDERRAQTDQMAAIMALMEQHSDTFGSPSVDDLRSQLGLYM